MVGEFQELKDFILNLKGSKVCYFEKGDIIIKQDDKVDFVFYLVDGLIYRTVLSEKGDETIYDTKSGDNQLKSLLGLLYLFDNGVSYTNFIAKTHCTCYKIPKEVIWKFISDKPDILRELINIAMNFYNSTIVLIQNKQQKKAVNRLCQFLLEQANVVNGKLAVRKACTNVEISKFLGIHPVTSARIIKCLIDEKVIVRCKNGLTILDENKLKEYAREIRNMTYS